MRAHLVQLDIRWEDRSANYAAVDRLVATTDISKGDLVILPEMFDSGFSLDIGRTNDRAGTTLGYCADLASRLGAWVQGGRTVLSECGQRATNRAPVLSPDGTLVCEYAKIHPFSFGREGERFDGGGSVEVWALPGTDRGLRCAPSICYDLRFPELFRVQTLMGAQVLCLGANWPAARQGHWRALAIARAIENQAYMLSVNRCGDDPHLSYAGGSIAVDPRGQVVGELGEGEGVLSVALDAGRVERWRASFPALDDIRMMGDDPERWAHA